MAASYKHIQQRRGTQKDFDSVNPLLRAGEAAFATDTNVLKVGNGTDKWRDLPEFISSKKLKKLKAIVDLPAISSGDYYSKTISFPGLLATGEYFISASPHASIDSNLTVEQAFHSANGEVTVKFLANSSQSPTTDLILYIVSYEITAPEQTTTTTPEPNIVTGDLYSWGNNQFGQLGLEDNADRYEPTRTEDTSLLAVSAGEYHTVLINSSYDLLTAGFNYYGQLGLGSAGASENKKDFTAVTELHEENATSTDTVKVEDNPKFTKCSAGSSHTLAVNDKGYLCAAGSNQYGCLGLGHADQRKYLVRYKSTQDELIEFDYFSGTAVTITDNKYTFPSLTSSYNSYKFILNRLGEHRILNVPSSGDSFALINFGKEDDISYSGEFFVQNKVVDGNEYPFYSGEILIDVSGDYGQVHAESLDHGDGGLVFYYTHDDLNWKDVAAGGQHSLAIKDGTAYTYGNNTFGQLGRADTISQPRNKPFAANFDSSTSNITKISAGSYHSLALDSDGQAFSCGKNDEGQLGHHDTRKRTDFTKIVATTIALDDDYEPVEMLEDSHAVIVNSFERYAFRPSNSESSTTLSNTVNDKYLLGVGSYTILGVDPTKPITLLNNGKSDKIYISGGSSAGSETLIGTTNDGTYTFYSGTVTIRVDGDFGKVSLYVKDLTGVGMTTSYPEISHQANLVHKDMFYFNQVEDKFVDISAGNNYSLLRTASNKIFACGENTNGQLGIGNNINQLGLVEIEGNWHEMSAGASHAVLVDEFKNLWTVGDNERGQLGSFDTIDRNKPFQVNDNINWTKPSAGGSHSHAAVYSFLPNAPTSISVKNADTSNYAGHNELEITWVNPDSYIDGVTHYIVEYSSNGGSTYTALPHTQSLSPPKTRVQYFNPLLSLIFRVKAVNRNGESLYSPVSTPISSVALIDPNYCDTLFLTHFNGDVEQTSERDAFFKDYSKNNYQLNPNIRVERVEVDDGQFGSALNPRNPEGVKYALDTNFVLESGFTIEAYIKPTSDANNETNPITNSWIKIDDLRKSNHGSEHELQLYGSEPLSGPNEGYTRLYYTPNNVDHGGGPGSSQVVCSGNITNDIFNHVAVVRTVDIPNSKFKTSMYINGIRTDQLEESFPVPTFSGVATSSIHFGRDDQLIDEVRISNIARYADADTLDVPTKPFGEGDASAC